MSVRGQLVNLSYGEIIVLNKAKTINAVLMFLGVCLLLICGEVSAASQPVMLQYSLEQLAAVTTTSSAQVTAETPTVDKPVPAPRRGDDALKQLLQLAGKKERKILERILEVGEQTGTIKVAAIKQKLGKINVPAVVELYRDVRTLKLAKLDAAHIEKIQGTLAEIDASLSGKGLSGRQVGDLAFFAGMARDRLATQAQNRKEKERLRREAVSNYQQSVEQLAEEKIRAVAKRLPMQANALPVCNTNLAIACHWRQKVAKAR